MSSCVVYKKNVSIDANTLWSATFVGSELHSFVMGATVIRFFNCIGTWGESSRDRYRERKFQGTKVPGNESTRERKFLGAKVPCNFRSRERKFQGTNVPGNESSRERKFHLWYFRSWERKYVGTKVP